MLTKTSPTSPPAHLGPGGRRLWESILSEFRITDAAGLELLRAAAEARDRLDDAGAVLREHGVVSVDAEGKPRAHPACAIERDSRSGLLQSLKALRLDVEPLNAAPGRPPGSFKR